MTWNPMTKLSRATVSGKKKSKSNFMAHPLYTFLEMIKKLSQNRDVSIYHLCNRCHL